MMDIDSMSALYERLKSKGVVPFEYFEVFKINHSKYEQTALAAANSHSLDGALTTQKHLLGNISQYSIITDPLLIKVEVCFWPDGLSDEQYYCEAWSEGSPARAWITAIVGAKIKHLEAVE